MPLEIITLSDEQRERFRAGLRIISPRSYTRDHEVRDELIELADAILITEQKAILGRFKDKELGLIIHIENLPMPEKLPEKPNGRPKYPAQIIAENEKRRNLPNRSVTHALLFFGGVELGALEEWVAGNNPDNPLHTDYVDSHTITALNCYRNDNGAETRCVDMAGVFRVLSDEDISQLCNTTFYNISNPKNTFPILGYSETIINCGVRGLSISDVFNKSDIDCVMGKPEEVLNKFKDALRKNSFNISLRPGSAAIFDNVQVLVDRGLPTLEGVLHGGPKDAKDSRWVVVEHLNRSKQDSDITR